MGVCPGRAGRGGSRESSPGGARGGAPGGSSPGAAGLGPGVSREPWSGAGAQRPGRGAPSGRGPGPHGNPRAAPWPPRCRERWPCWPCGFPRETGGWLKEDPAQFCSDPGVRRSQSHALRATGSVQDWRAQ
ncbi:translation initiation factor IF-2-like [Lutra lutra]|uniref:translation initiation factor IF-2-like n=1 Tax=Lutra lutra TaxID=9657 RepID=UPI001FD15DDC|nr:translation initiation factor IF-2-like [Lutra lutra]